MSGEKVTIVDKGVPVPSGREDYVWLDSGMISIDVGDALLSRSTRQLSLLRSTPVGWRLPVTALPIFGTPKLRSSTET